MAQSIIPSADWFFAVQQLYISKKPKKPKRKNLFLFCSSSSYEFVAVPRRPHELKSCAQIVHLSWF